MIIGIDGNEANIKNRVGSNEYAFEIIKNLWQIGDKHEWTVYLREAPLEHLPTEKKNWKYKVIGPKKFWTKIALPFHLFFKSPRPDVFFSPGHYSPKYSLIPVVASIMDLGYLKFPDQFTKKDYYQLKLWTAGTIKSASHLLAISESTKNDIINKYNVPKDKITVTYLGFDNDKFKKDLPKARIEEVKNKYQIKDKYFLFLGTLKPNKNIEGLLDAYSLWLNALASRSLMAYGKNEEISLVIAGKKGWLFNTIFEKVKSLGLEDKVIFTDFVDENDVPYLLAGAEVFVLPSFWEGFGIPALEAMACGTPVVVSNVASLPEVVGESGILIDPYKPEEIAQGMNKAILNKVELAKKGLNQAEKFSWKKCAEQTLEVLEKYDHL